MFNSAYKVARVWGIPIKIHISLLVLLLYLALRVGFDGGPLAILIIVAIEIGVFTSIALHELGHSFVAMRKGCRVREITLMFMGGAAQMDRMPSRPRDELQMALAGPAVSIALGLIIWFGGGALPLTVYLLPFFGMDVPCNLVQVVGLINFLLAAFNLLPAFPMDGGRVLRALLTPKLGRLRATFIASRLGKLLAVLFGLYGLLASPTRWILVAIAFFIYAAAGREYRMVQMQEAARAGAGGFGFGFRPPFGGTPQPPSSTDDEVIISPPPYEKRGEQRAELDRE